MQDNGSFAEDEGPFVEDGKEVIFDYWERLIMKLMKVFGRVESGGAESKMKLRRSSWLRINLTLKARILGRLADTAVVVTTCQGMDSNLIPTVLCLKHVFE